jgi:cardiolipin synthase
MLEAMTGRKTTYSNRVELLTNASIFYPRLLRDIDAAKEHIHLEFYIWNDDAAGREFLEALIRAAGRGVQVRLLVDEIGSIEVKSSFFKPLVKAGGSFSWFLSLHFLRNRFFFNLRNHRKLVIIDGRAGYVGGTNIGDEYLGKDPRYGNWRDSHFRVEGACVPQLQEVFADDWYFATDEKITAPDYYPEASEAGSQTVQVIEDGPDTEFDPLHMICLDLIAQAEERVWIQTPYFIPYPDMIAHLQMAALKGLDVRLILAGRLDHPYLLQISRSYYDDLLRGGVKIFEYQPGILHSKLMMVDGVWNFAGSANMDIRSFRLNFELNLVIHDAGLGQQIERQMTADLAQSREIRWSEFRGRPWIHRARESVLRLLAPAV